MSPFCFSFFFSLSVYIDILDATISVLDSTSLRYSLPPPPFLFPTHFCFPFHLHTDKPRKAQSLQTFACDWKTGGITGETPTRRDWCGSTPRRLETNPTLTSRWCWRITEGQGHGVIRRPIAFVHSLDVQSRSFIPSTSNRVRSFPRRPIAFVHSLDVQSRSFIRSTSNRVCSFARLAGSTEAHACCCTRSQTLVAERLEIAEGVKAAAAAA